MMQDEQPADEKLLQAYLMRRDEAAFGHLVQRHLGLVFGTAFRLLGERTSAEEVAQNVFITLARKAASIRPDGGLAGWLHRAAVLEARLRQRTDLRRRNREDLAAQLAATMPPPGSRRFPTARYSGSGSPQTARRWESERRADCRPSTC